MGDVRELLEKVGALEDAYSRWMLLRRAGTLVQKAEASERLEGALFAIFDAGEEDDDEPCELIAILRALSEDRQ